MSSIESITLAAATAERGTAIERVAAARVQVKCLILLKK